MNSTGVFSGFFHVLSWSSTSSLTLCLWLTSYCDVVWENCAQHNSSRLQSLFTYACRLALHCPLLSSSSSLWKELGLSSLRCHSKLHLSELTYKCHKSLAPPYLTSLFCLPTHHHNTRTKAHVNVNLPVVRTTFRQHAYPYTGATLWRSQPASSRESGSPEEFSRAAYFLYHTMTSECQLYMLHTVFEFSLAARFFLFFVPCCTVSEYLE